MGIRSNKILFNASTASTGDWYFLDARYEMVQQRAIHGTVTTGDTIIIEGITKDIRCTETPLLATLDPEDIATIQKFTGDFSYVLEGNWTWIRVRKEGSTATAIVQGRI